MIVPEAFKEMEYWKVVLQRVSSRPFKFCLDFSARANRHAEWWKCKNATPLILAKGLTGGIQKVERHFDLLGKPAAWLDARLHQFDMTVFLRDALPYVQLDFGASILAGLLGARINYQNQYSWIEPANQDLGYPKSYEIDPDDEIWRQMNALLEDVLPQIAETCLLVLPDLGGSSDALMNLIGAEKLCLDLIDRPQAVHQALEDI
ncbi:MAG TPA: hypothetical protein VF338_05365, partial [Leptolinea sp.]